MSRFADVGPIVRERLRETLRDEGCTEEEIERLVADVERIAKEFAERIKEHR